MASDKDWKKDKDFGDKGEKLWIEWFEKFHTVFECKLFNVKESQTTKHIDGVIVVNFRYNSSLIEIKSRTFNYFKEYFDDNLILLEVDIIDGEAIGGYLDSVADILCYGFLSEDKIFLINPMCFHMHEIQLFLKEHTHEYKIIHSKNSDTPFILVPSSMLEKFRVNYLREENA